MIIAAILSSVSLLGWLYLAFFHGQFWRPQFDEQAQMPPSWPSVDIVIHAHDEANVLRQTLPFLFAQNYAGNWRLILVDDHSQDGTAAIATKIAADEHQSNRLVCVETPDIPDGWNRKVFALNAGVEQSAAEYILFTEPDIQHPMDNIRQLISRAIESKFDLVSQLAKMNCQSVIENIFVPASVFFFAMVHPFRRSNDPDRSTAAAGQVMLVKQRALHNIGGLARIKSAVAVNCELAKAIKTSGGEKETPGKTWISFSKQVKCLSRFFDFRDAWKMIVTSTLVSQYRSMLSVVMTIIGGFILFLVPIILPASGWPMATEMGLGAWFIMTVIYATIILFYDLSLAWAFTLPAAGLVYIAAVTRQIWHLRPKSNGLSTDKPPS